MEQTDGVVTGEWNSQGSTSINFSGKPEATYTYYLRTEFCLCESTMEYGFLYSDPSYVQVDYPDPIVNVTFVPNGPLFQTGQPSGYYVSWSSSHATSCDLKREWHLHNGQIHTQTNSGVPLAFNNLWVPRGYSDIDFAFVYVTCHGTGGTIEDGRRLEFW
ncbi:MAG TPA: hypothetical protein VLI71_09240 [Gammaproteobacteria bacterium]|nr:hypothetical protein [Gammaproteobacteria bacterium]